ncbi:MAG: hypothetical protein HQL18_05400, partial [Candidatus Omnitrophica bacterium]|nr:hypothetical protein [Candidatus Omnitrophota bacterium]
MKKILVLAFCLFALVVPSRFVFAATVTVVEGGDVGASGAPDGILFTGTTSGVARVQNAAVVGQVPSTSLSVQIIYDGVGQLIF